MFVPRLCPAENRRGSGGRPTRRKGKTEREAGLEESAERAEADPPRGAGQGPGVRFKSGWKGSLARISGNPRGSEIG